MKKQLNNFFRVFTVILFLFSSKSYAIEDVSEFTDAINEAREEFNNISEATTEQSKIIDDAFKEIDKATEYVQDAIENDNIEDAIKTLEFMEKSLNDVESIIPKEFSSDMSNIDTSGISKEDMNDINELTAQMNVASEKNKNEFMADLVDLNLKGIDTVSISENLNGMGIKTIEMVLDVEGAKNIEKWTKEQWAESYKGSILTSAGDEVISDKEINNKVVDLEQQLQINKTAILDKRTSLTVLQTKIDPLTNQITDLKTQKTDLLAKYNKEILKQSSTILSDQEINKSKELTKQLNKQLGNIKNEIKVAEKQSNSFQKQVKSLNLELTNEITNKTQLENNIRNLNNQLSANQNALSQKTSELNQLKNTDLNEKINSLNENLQSVSRERDFIETDFERSIDLEVEALQRYHSALGETEEEIDFAMREVGVIMDSDPRKARAFEIEKYATYAGFSKSQIQSGINAVNSDDWDSQKNFYKEITTALSKNPNWQVDIPSNAELNVIIEEEKAIQAAALASMDLDRINSEWNEKINEQLKDVGPELGLNITTLKYAATWEGMREHDFIKNEYEKLISESNLAEATKNLTKTNKDYLDYMSTDWQSSANLGNYDLNKALDLQRKYYEASSTVFNIEAEARKISRQNVIKRAEEATAKYNEIISQVNPDRVAVEQKVASILKEVPTFEEDAEKLAGLDPTTLRARLVDITNGNNNESKALSAARDAVSKIGNTPIGNLTGPTWQMTNVKAAAIVRSKKYDYVDDYAYIQAEYGDPLSLNSSQREEIEGELKNILSKDNVKLQALNTKVTKLTKELNLTKEQSQNLTTEISKLEDELDSLKNSKSDLQKQIDDLTSQFNSKESLIAEKTQNLRSIQEKLNPITEKMNALQGQRAELDGKLNNQLNTIANQVKDQGQVTDEANALKAQFESQIAELDNQIKEFENQSKEINSQLTKITTELSVLETENPELANQIASLNQDLESFKELKADLAMATAKKLGINVNEKTLKSVKLIDGKVVVALEGSNLVSVVDEKMLINDAAKFIDTTSELAVNSKVYTAGALNRELITPAFVKAAKSISVSDKIDVIAQASAVEAVGATTEQSAKYASAKATRLAARKEWDAALASGDKAAADAAEAAFMAARDVEQVAGQEAVAAAAAASSAAAATAAQQVASAAQEASSAAQQAAAEVQDVVNAAASAQQAALDALYELEALPGATGFHSQQVQAAIEQLEAEMEGRDFNFLGQSSYEDAMQEIDRMESTGKSVVECMSQEGC